jgi:hypothetical protein
MRSAMCSKKSTLGGHFNLAAYRRIGILHLIVEDHLSLLANIAWKEIINIR